MFAYRDFYDIRINLLDFIQSHLTLTFPQPVRTDSTGKRYFSIEKTIFSIEKTLFSRRENDSHLSIEKTTPISPSRLRLRHDSLHRDIVPYFFTETSTPILIFHRENDFYFSTEKTTFIFSTEKTTLILSPPPRQRLLSLHRENDSYFILFSHRENDFYFPIEKTILILFFPRKPPTSYLTHSTQKTANHSPKRSDSA